MAVDNRAFGVEIEHATGNSLTRELMRNLGFTLGVTSRTWRLGYDGSEVELRSPILRGADGLRELRTVMTALKEDGAYVTEEDGLHVHHDAPEFKGTTAEAKRLRKVLAYTWANNEEIIERFVDDYRRDGYWACPKFLKKFGGRDEDGLWEAGIDLWEATEEEIEEATNEAWGLQQIEQGNIPILRGNLNFSNLRAGDKGTIEIRLHEGTLDANEAVSWIRFGQALLRYTLSHERPLRTCADIDQLLRRLRVAPTAMEQLRMAAERKG